MTVEDALLAVDSGAKAIILSNHGGQAVGWESVEFGGRVGDL